MLTGILKLVVEDHDPPGVHGGFVVQCTDVWCINLDQRW